MKNTPKRLQARYFIVWEFKVAASQRRNFERAYGPNGVWGKFFRSAPEYLGTELLRDVASPGRYLTTDSWTSEAAYERFKRVHAAEYKEIDKQCEALTQTELEIGRFQALPRRAR